MMTKKEFQESVDNTLLKANELMKGVANNVSCLETEDGKFDLSGISNILDRLKEISAKGENFDKKDIIMYSLVVTAIDLLESRNKKQGEISDFMCETEQIMQKQKKCNELLERAKRGDLSCLDEAGKINEECESLLERCLDDDID